MTNGVRWGTVAGQLRLLAADQVGRRASLALCTGIVTSRLAWFATAGTWFAAARCCINDGALPLSPALKNVRRCRPNPLLPCRSHSTCTSLRGRSRANQQTPPAAAVAAAVQLGSCSPSRCCAGGWARRHHPGACAPSTSSARSSTPWGPASRSSSRQPMLANSRLQMRRQPPRRAASGRRRLPPLQPGRRWPKLQLAGALARAVRT